MAFSNDVSNEHVMDPDAVRVINETWDALPNDCRRKIKGDCESGKELWAMELALQAAFDLGFAFSNGALESAASAAEEIGREYARRIRDVLAPPRA